jgi:hypothetical protein
MLVASEMTVSKRTANGTSFGEPGRSARVTCQFNDKGKKVYELDCDATTVSLTMSPEPGNADQWHIEAFVRDGEAPRVLKASGDSRDAALHAVSQAWDGFDGRDGYRRLNWRAIHEALAAVRGV